LRKKKEKRELRKGPEKGKKPAETWETGYATLHFKKGQRRQKPPSKLRGVLGAGERASLAPPRKKQSTPAKKKSSNIANIADFSGGRSS